MDIVSYVAAKAGATVKVYDVDVKSSGTTTLSGSVIQTAGTKAQEEFTNFQDDTPENMLSATSNKQKA